MSQPLEPINELRKSNGRTFFDKQGKPLADIIEWGRLFKDPKYRKIAVDETPLKKYFITTTWTGYTLSVSERPLIFETMVLESKISTLHMSLQPTEFATPYKYNQPKDMIRYATEAEAVEGHKKMLVKWTSIEDEH